MRKYLFIALLLLTAPLVAHANDNVQGWCEAGATLVVTQGLTSVTQVQGSFPQCTITINVHGGGLATIYSDNNNTVLGNPFVAQTDGQWIAYAAQGRYDITMSGGGLLGPVTYTDVVLYDPAQPSSVQCALASTTTPLFNAQFCSYFSLTLTGDVTSSNVANANPGETITISLLQGSGGPYSFVWPSNFLNPPVFTLLAGEEGQYSFILGLDGNWRSIAVGEALPNNVNLFQANTVVIMDGSVYPLTAAGAQKAVNKVQGTSCSGKGLVFFPANQYAFGTANPAVTVSCQGVHILGVGKKASEIDQSSGVSFKFVGSAPLYQDSIEGLFFNGLSDATNANQKIAIQAIDTSELNIADIDVLNWNGNSGSSTTPSMGFDLQGRELTTINRVSVNADRPMNINLDPNIATESADALHVTDFYGIPIAGESCFHFVPGSVVTHSVFDRWDCASGDEAVYWNETGTPSAVSSDIDFRNGHHENGTNSSAYSLYFARAGGQIQGLKIDNVETSVQSNGLYMQRILGANVNLIDPQAGGTCINADATVFNLNTIGTTCQSGSLVVNNSQSASTDYNFLTQFLTSGFSTPTPSGNMEISGGPAGAEITGNVYFDMGASNFELRRIALATSSVNLSSPVLSLIGACWDSGSGVSYWGFEDALGTGTNPPEHLSLIHTSSCVPSSVSLDVYAPLTVDNQIAATSLLNQAPPPFSMNGFYWNGLASILEQYEFSTALGTGTNPTSTLLLSHSGTSGYSEVQIAPPLGASVMNQLAANTWSGIATMSLGAYTVTFPSSYKNKPSCHANDETAIAPVKVTPSVSSLILNTAGASDVVDWECTGNPN